MKHSDSSSNETLDNSRFEDSRLQSKADCCDIESNDNSKPSTSGFQKFSHLKKEKHAIDASGHVDVCPNGQNPFSRENFKQKICKSHKNRYEVNSDVIPNGSSQELNQSSAVSAKRKVNLSSRHSMYNYTDSSQGRNDSSSLNNGNSSPDSEPIHMTLEEVRNSLKVPAGDNVQATINKCRSNTLKSCLGRTFALSTNLSIKKNANCDDDDKSRSYRKSFPSSWKSSLKNIFNVKKSHSTDSSVLQRKFSKSDNQLDQSLHRPSHSVSNPAISPFNQRTLPPVPVFYPGGELANPHYDIETRAFMASVDDDGFIVDAAHQDFKTSKSSDFAASIERVKDCGWYWGPVNGETAEKLLSTEPDGSFIVRDSSDEHYIFSLTFKLNGLVRHVRIEHDQGNFSFGSLQKFKSTTIVDFIENAVEHSRSGRYLFFLHRRPVLGPMRVQLLHPLSRFKHVQSLQHICRFVILKLVRRDLVGELPLPQRLKDYLNSPNYYSEEVDMLFEQDETINVTSTLNDFMSASATSSTLQASEENLPVVDRSFSVDSSASAVVNGDDLTIFSGSSDIADCSNADVNAKSQTDSCHGPFVEEQMLRDDSSASFGSDDDLVADCMPTDKKSKTLHCVETVETSIGGQSSEIDCHRCVSSPFADDLENCEINNRIDIRTDESTLNDDHYEQVKEKTVEISAEVISNGDSSTPEYLDPHRLNVC